MEVEQVEELNYSFDGLGWLEHEGHLHRKVLFLDLNFWIRLSEHKNPSHEQLNALLSDLVETGKLICPVSPPILMELWKQSRGTHRDSISQLMNELSKGLSLRDIYTTFPPEFEAALDGRQAERQVAYSHFLDAFYHPVPDQPMAISITDFMNEWWSGARERAAANMDQGFSGRTQQQNGWRQKNRPTRKKVEEDEWNATFRELCFAILSVLCAHGCPIPERELRDKLDSCPSFWCHYKCMTELRWHKPVKENDVWDFLHVAMAAPYVDCLATDGSTRSILSAGTLKMDKKFATRVISQEPELIDWLQGV